MEQKAGDKQALAEAIQSSVDNPFGRYIRKFHTPAEELR